MNFQGGVWTVWLTDEFGFTIEMYEYPTPPTGPCSQCQKLSPIRVIISNDKTGKVANLCPTCGEGWFIRTWPHCGVDNGGMAILSHGSLGRFYIDSHPKWQMKNYGGKS